MLILHMHFTFCLTSKMTKNCTAIIGTLKSYTTKFLTLYFVHCSQKVKWVFAMYTVHIYFIVCRCIYRICSNRISGKYEYGTVLELIIS